MTSITHSMAQFATQSHIFPSLAKTRARDAVIDCLGCALAGSDEEVARVLLKTISYSKQLSQHLTALMLGTDFYASPTDAALFNGTIAHALDYDDTNHPAYAHPSAVIVPALLSLVPICKPSGESFLSAYIIGFETFGKLGRALNTQHYKRGWHATGTLGAIASTMAAGHLLNLNSDQMVMALGIAASSASGLRVNFGSMVKPLHAGMAARSGVQAALWAQAGMLASNVAMDHDFGYLHVFNANIGFDLQPLTQMGHDLEILTAHGLALKPYPSCGATHPGIEAAISLHEQIKNETITSVHAGVCEMAFSPLIHVMPNSPLEGKFSLHFCLAAALLEGRVDLATFTPTTINNPAIRQLIPKIEMKLDEALKLDSEFPTRIQVKTQSGQFFEAFVPLAKGKPERWFDQKTIHRKFFDCAESTLGKIQCDCVLQAFEKLDAAPSVDQLLDLIRPSISRRLM
ncbi:MAG: MmgE/PrpD family protein [Burkholderiaceae bacterium]